MPFRAHDPPGQARSALHLARPFPAIVEPTTILVVDHDAAVRDALSLTLRASGFRVDTYGSAQALLGKASFERKGCLLIEYDLEDMTGVELLTRLDARRIVLPAIVMSARLRPLTIEDPRPPGMIAVLQKPFGQDALLRCLRHVLGDP